MLDRKHNNRSTVYIVDGDSEVCESVASVLEVLSFEVRSFGSAEQMLEVGANGTPDCLVVEVDLPGISGLEFLEVLEETGLEAPVIMIARKGEVRTAVRALQAGAADFIEKPFLDQVLIRSVQRVTATHKNNGHHP